VFENRIKSYSVSTRLLQLSAFVSVSSPKTILRLRCVELRDLFSAIYLNFHITLYRYGGTVSSLHCGSHSTDYKECPELHFYANGIAYTARGFCHPADTHSLFDRVAVFSDWLWSITPARGGHRHAAKATPVASAQTCPMITRL